jgi:3-phenylpropionate/trans-cinnamate dioxygenase ferredoxin reductase component
MSSAGGERGDARRVVVVGGGLAGASAVEELRDRGFDGDVVLLGAEAHLPYDRPPLSKDVLLGKKDADATTLHDAQWYADRAVDVRAGTPARSVDLGRRVVGTDGGEVSYDRLLLATGSAPRPLEVGDGTPTMTLREREDAARLRRALEAGVRLVIVGAGWIGLEAAAAAREAGCEVTVVEPQAQPLLGALGPVVGAAFADLHRQHGVDLRLGATFDDIAPVRADLVLVAVGAAPRTDLARAAGLEVGAGPGGGVLVDAALRTSDPHVWAAGDIADHDHPTLGRLRVEHWDNAIGQGRAAARAMLASPGEEPPYDGLPYFFTDQYDVGIEYVGHVPRGRDAALVVRGDLDRREAVVLWHDDGLVLAGMHLNVWDATDGLRAVVGRRVDPGRLADPGADLSALAGVS